MSSTRLALLGCLVAACVAGCAPSNVAQSPARPPPSGARVSYQLGGAYPPPAGVAIVDRDRSAPPVEGLYSICYVNGFQVQPDELGWWQSEHPDLLLRNGAALVVDEQWAEPLLDTRNPQRLMDVVGPWIDACAQSGFQAVEPDNLDSFTRSDGLLDAADNLRFGQLLADRAHAHGLAIGQKNSAEQSADARRAGFDFAVAEECQVYVECDLYTAVYGDALIEIEYTDQVLGAFTTACEARGGRVSVVRRDRGLAPSGAPGYVEQWC